MKKLLLACVFALSLPFSVSAAELTFPSDAPVASITIPDSWGPKETETGVDATSRTGQSTSRLMSLMLLRRTR